MVLGGTVVIFLSRLSHSVYPRASDMMNLIEYVLGSEVWNSQGHDRLLSRTYGGASCHWREMYWEI